MMRKVNALILAFVYFILSTGIIITLHHCHDHLSDFKVFGAYGDESGCCELNHNEGFSHQCCTFDTISGKITQEHVTTDNSQIITPKENIVTIFSFVPQLSEVRQSSEKLFSFNFHPPKDIPVLHCSLTFYG